MSLSAMSVVTELKTESWHRSKPLQRCNTKTTGLCKTLHPMVDLQVKVRSTGKKQFRRPKFAIRCAKNPGKRCRVTGAMPPIFQRCEVRF